MHDIERTANLLGATVLAGHTAMSEASAAVTDGGLNAAAALVTLAAEPGLGVTELARRVGLSQPGTVRMVDGLAARRLVVRMPGADGRALALRLTAAGRAAARRILAARERALADLLAPLDAEALRQLDAALSSVLAAMTHRGASPYQTCRLCDERACESAGPCPVDAAYRREPGSGPADLAQRREPGPC
jgi:MarR family transcriptional regulator, negative regulator of the multidrug operon emrRAB